MGLNTMKTYVNKTRFQKRIVFSNRKTGETNTVFLRSGQKFDCADEVKIMEDGIKVREQKTVGRSTPKKTEEKDEQASKE